MAVLGGRLGALTAAFELTAPELAGRYEVTVYQRGWRLGGTCASRGDGDGEPLGEHGSPVWFGFYANAFALIQRCYAEWTPPGSSPLRTWQDAFKPSNDIVLFERWKGERKPWHLDLAPNDQVPGTRHDVDPWEFLRRLLEFLLDQWGRVREQHGRAFSAAARESGRALHLPAVDTLAHAFGDRVQELDREAATHLLELAFKVAQACSLDPGGHGGGHQHAGDVASLLRAFKRWLFDDALEPLIDVDPVRRYAIVLDFWATTVGGMVQDGVFERGFGQINDVDLRAWLRRHGAERLTLEQAAFPAALYELAFASVDGDERRPDLPAGQALQALIRIVLDYKGAVLWKMPAGIGDSVLTPLYDVLRHRGVRFRFFHHVTKLGVSDDEPSVRSIEVQPQARVARGRYDPIVTVGGRRSWPSEPKWPELVGGEALAEQAINFERELNPLGLKPLVLEAGHDFDEIVLGIPVAELPPLSEELAVAGVSGLDNLWLAGDWTRNGIVGGCGAEAAITSGMQAARAISGHPRTIQGEHGWLGGG